MKIKFEFDTLSILYLVSVWAFDANHSWKIWTLETAIFLVCRFIKMIIEAVITDKPEPKTDNQTTWDSYHV